MASFSRARETRPRAPQLPHPGQRTLSPSTLSGAATHAAAYRLRPVPLCSQAWKSGTKCGPEPLLLGVRTAVSSPATSPTRLGRASSEPGGWASLEELVGERELLGELSARRVHLAAREGVDREVFHHSVASVWADKDRRERSRGQYGRGSSAI